MICIWEDILIREQKRKYKALFRPNFSHLHSSAFFCSHVDDRPAKVYAAIVIHSPIQIYIYEFACWYLCWVQTSRHFIARLGSRFEPCRTSLLCLASVLKNKCYGWLMIEQNCMLGSFPIAIWLESSRIQLSRFHLTGKIPKISPYPKKHKMHVNFALPLAWSSTTLIPFLQNNWFTEFFSCFQENADVMQSEPEPEDDWTMFQTQNFSLKHIDMYVIFVL